jgi:hypothetical protein
MQEYPPPKCSTGRNLSGISEEVCGCLLGYNARVTTQKTAIFILAAVRTSNPTCLRKITKELNEEILTSGSLWDPNIMSVK